MKLSGLTEVQFFLQAAEPYLQKSKVFQVEKLVSFHTGCIAAYMLAGCVAVLLVLREACVRFVVMAAGCGFFAICSWLAWNAKADMSCESRRFDCCSRQHNLSVFPLSCFCFSATCNLSVLRVKSDRTAHGVGLQLVDLRSISVWNHCFFSMCAGGTRIPLNRTTGSHSGDLGSLSAAGTFLCVWGSIEMEVFGTLK